MPGPVAQHFFRGRIGEQDLALGVDDEHGLGDAVEGVLQHRGRMPELFMGGDQMLGALGDRGLQRLVGGLGGAQRVLQFAARSAGRPDQHGREDQDQHDAGKIDRQQEAPCGAGIGVAGREARSHFGDGFLEIDADLFHRRAAFGPRHQRGNPPAVSPAVCSLIISLADGDAANGKRLGLLEQSALRRDYP